MNTLALLRLFIKKNLAYVVVCIRALFFCIKGVSREKKELEYVSIKKFRVTSLKRIDTEIVMTKYETK